MRGLVALCILCTAGARADEIRADIGLASAVGFGGLTYTRTLSDRLWLEGGVGRGISGFQFSAMPKFVFAGPWSALFLGLGPAVSLKRLGPQDVGGAFRRYGTGVWINAEFGFHVAARSGLTLSAAAGGAVGLWGNHMLREPRLLLSDSYAGIRGLATPQARVGVGYAF